MSFPNRLRSAINGLQKTGSALEKIVSKIKTPTQIIPIRPSTGLIYTMLLVPLLYFATACTSTRESDYIEAGASAAQLSNNLPLEGRIIAKGIEILAGNAGDNERAKDSAPEVDVYPRNSEPPKNLEHEAQQEIYDALNSGFPITILSSPRTLESTRYENRIAFIFDYGTNRELMLLDLDDKIEPIKNLSKSPKRNESSVRWSQDGRELVFTAAGFHHFEPKDALDNAIYESKKNKEGFESPTRKRIKICKNSLKEANLIGIR